MTGRHGHHREGFGPPPWARRPHASSGRPPYGAPFWQRRFLRLAVAIALVWIGAGIVFGFVFGGGRDGDTGPPNRAFIPILVGVAVAATIVAYRRIARPVSSLLDGATRIGDGDYNVRVRPDGPRSVRALGHAFNDMATRLDASDTARRRFLADVTHELRTPLTVLQAGVEAQLDGIHLRDDEHLTTLLEQTRTLARLVDDLRTLASSDAGQLAIALEPASLNDVIEEAAAAMRPMAAARLVTVEIAEPAPPTSQFVDRTRLVQVLTNLLANAVRHTPAGGSVTVALRARANGSTITVDDTGPGIDSDPELLFDRFHRAADSGGSGLGLTIARQLVAAHGGTITASNRAGPDGARLGARFTVTLPGDDVVA